MVLLELGLKWLVVCERSSVMGGMRVENGVTRIGLTGKVMCVVSWVWKGYW